MKGSSSFGRYSSLELWERLVATVAIFFSTGEMNRKPKEFKYIKFKEELETVLRGYKDSHYKPS